MLEIEKFIVGEYRVNAYLLKDVETGTFGLLDTGESDEIVKILCAEPIRPNLKYIFLTHAHVDHAGGVFHLQCQFDVKTYLPADERPVFELLPQQGSMFGHPELNNPCGFVDHELIDGEEIQFGNTTLKFISTPGHTPGHGCYYTDLEVFTGDLLFQGTVGRTDLLGGDPRLMKESLKKLFNLPHSLKVYPGHGPDTTLASELKKNFFLGFLRR